MNSEAENNACFSCQRKLYKAGPGRCLFFKGHRVVACSHYVGPFREMHVKVMMGPDYKEAIYRK